MTISYVSLMLVLSGEEDLIKRSRDASFRKIWERLLLRYNNDIYYLWNLYTEDATNASLIKSLLLMLRIYFQVCCLITFFAFKPVKCSLISSRWMTFLRPKGF